MEQTMWPSSQAPAPLFSAGHWGAPTSSCHPSPRCVCPFPPPQAPSPLAQAGKAELKVTEPTFPAFPPPHSELDRTSLGHLLWGLDLRLSNYDRPHLRVLGRMATPLTPTSLSGSPNLHPSGAFSPNLPSPVYPTSVPPCGLTTLPFPSEPPALPLHLQLPYPCLPPQGLSVPSVPSATPSRPLPIRIPRFPPRPLNGKHWSA